MLIPFIALFHQFIHVTHRATFHFQLISLLLNFVHLLYHLHRQCQFICSYSNSLWHSHSSFSSIKSSFDFRHHHLIWARQPTITPKLLLCCLTTTFHNVTIQPFTCLWRILFPNDFFHLVNMRFIHLIFTANSVNKCQIFIFIVFFQLFDNIFN